MIKTNFKVVKHDDGWVYEANGAQSESFRTREAARKAARWAARLAASETETVRREDKDEEWFDDTG